MGDPAGETPTPTPAGRSRSGSDDRSGPPERPDPRHPADRTEAVIDAAPTTETETDTDTDTAAGDEPGAGADRRVDDDLEHQPTLAAPGDDDAVRHWACVAARAAAGKTDQPTVVLEVAPVLAIVEYFVITAGRNPRQVRALADEVEEQLTRAGGPKPTRVEGRDTQQWVLMDYGDFVVHVFLDEMRAFYDLEKLWRDVARIDWRAAVGDPDPS